MEDGGYLKPRPLLASIGVYFVLTFVFVNVLILLNVVIALMADTYGLMTSVRRGIFNFNIVKSVSAYKPDKYYGGLILLNTPFNVLSTILLPFYVLIQDKKRLEILNLSVYRIVYAVIAVILVAIFMSINLAMMPFAFLKTFLHKINLVRMNIIPWYQCLAYFMIGVPLLLMS